MLLKLFLLVTLWCIVASGDSKDDIKKIKDSLSQGGKVKQHTVNVVGERGYTDKAATSKSEHKAAAGKKFDDSKKADKDHKKKISGTHHNGKDKASQAAKSAKKKGEKTSEKLSQQKENLKHTVSDIGENLKSTVAETQAQAEQSSEGFVQRILHLFSSGKSSESESVESASNTPGNTTDQNQAKAGQASDSLKKTGKSKKKSKETSDL